MPKKKLDGFETLDKPKVQNSYDRSDVFKMIILVKYMFTQSVIPK